MLIGRYESKYSAKPLKSALEAFFDPATSLFAPAKSGHFQSTARVAVTTARDEGETEWIIANYNRPSGNWTRFEREDDAAKDMKIWEAALATSAAPYYLPPFRKRLGSADYIDGAVYANCPAKLAIEEKHKLWPNDSTALDVLLSLGTGRQSERASRIPKAVKYGFFTPLLKMFERQMDSERTWDELERNSSARVKSRLHRLNPPIQGGTKAYVGIDDQKEMQNLMKKVEYWTDQCGAKKIQKISHILMANLFFFEPDPENPPVEGGSLCGSVRCRLQHESEELRTLLTQVVGFWHVSVPRAASKLNTLADGAWRSLNDSSEPVVKECNVRKFRLNFQLPPAMNAADCHVLAVQLDSAKNKIPISGFPASLAELSERCKSQWLQ
jgi:hypothetical protein